MNIKNLWKEFRIWARWAENMSVVLMRILLLLGIALIIIFPKSAVSFILFCVLVMPSAMFVGVIMIVGIDDLPRNWRLVIHEAIQFKQKFGQKEKIDFLIISTLKNKNASRLYEFMNQYRELERKKYELAGIQKCNANSPHMTESLMFEIKSLTENLKHI